MKTTSNYLILLNISALLSLYFTWEGPHNKIVASPSLLQYLHKLHILSTHTQAHIHTAADLAYADGVVYEALCEVEDSVGG